jgi:hypothetical protein
VVPDIGCYVMSPMNGTPMFGILIIGTGTIG